MKVALVVFAAVVVLGAGGCSPLLVKSDVSVFHALPANVSGISFAMIPLASQAGDLEYTSYARTIQERLIEHGMVENTVVDADVLVAFNYAIDQGRVAVVMEPVWGPVGTASSTTSGTVTWMGDFGVVNAQTTYERDYGFTQKPVSRTEYSRVLKLVIVDRQALANHEYRPLYQADVISVGSSAQMAPVMPTMIGAIFRDFPGKSGDTRHDMAVTR